MSTCLKSTGTWGGLLHSSSLLVLRFAWLAAAGVQVVTQWLLMWLRTARLTQG